MAAKFAGFPRETLGFLRELSAKNNRDWFMENKPRYERHVVEPAFEFIAAMEPRLEKISKRFMALPSRTGGSLIRIYRDTRFSKGLPPYKTNLGIQFRHELGKDIHSPGYYVHIAPEGCFICAGMWRPERELLARIRQRIDEHRDEWQAVRRDRAMKRSWYFDGAALKRAPKGYPPDHPLIEDLRRTDFIVTHEMSETEFNRPGLVKDVAMQLGRATPVMRFLCKAVGVPF